MIQRERTALLNELHPILSSENYFRMVHFLNSMVKETEHPKLKNRYHEFAPRGKPNTTQPESEVMINYQGHTFSIDRLPMPVRKEIAKRVFNEYMDTDANGRKIHNNSGAHILVAHYNSWLDKEDK